MSARLSKQNWVQSAVINRRSPTANKHTSAQTTSNSPGRDWGTTEVSDQEDQAETVEEPISKRLRIFFLGKVHN